MKVLRDILNILLNNMSANISEYETCKISLFSQHQSNFDTVYSRYITVGGVQTTVQQYKWECNLSGDCHEPKSGSILQRVMSADGAFVCLAANPACRQRI